MGCEGSSKPMPQKEQMSPDWEQPSESSVKEMVDFNALYAEFAEEDRTLAEAGMSDYAVGLAREDDAQ